jgi:hypothetical protein
VRTKRWRTRSTMNGSLLKSSEQEGSNLKGSAPRARNHKARADDFPGTIR